MTRRYGLAKKEKLKSRKEIEALFAGRQRLFVHPLQVWYAFEKGEAAALQIGVSCSKKHFKRAVDRNRIKRLLREAYRLQKHSLLESLSPFVKGKVFFIFIDKELPTYEQVFQAMTQCLQQLKKKAAYATVA